MAAGGAAEGDKILSSIIERYSSFKRHGTGQVARAGPSLETSETDCPLPSLLGPVVPTAAANFRRSRATRAMHFAYVSPPPPRTNNPRRDEHTLGRPFVPSAAEPPNARVRYNLSSPAGDKRRNAGRRIAIAIECSAEIEILTGHRCPGEKPRNRVPFANIRSYVMAR